MTARDAFLYAFAFLLLVACNAAGGLLASVLHLPVPGTVIGILILLGGLAAYGRVPQPIRRVAEFLLYHLNFFYIPAGVGVMVYAALVRQDLLPIVAALIGGTCLALIAGALAFHWTAKLTGNAPDEKS
jgi:holin-like protein